MLFNYIKIAIRSLVKKRVFSLLNISGLALGMSACLSIFYYVNYEFSFNKSFTESENIYRAYFSRQMEDGKFRVYKSPAAGLKVRLDDVPEIESSFRMANIDYQNNSIIYDGREGRKIIEQTGVRFADADIQKTLSLELVSGSFESMNEPMKVVLSKEVASKFFDPQDAIGKTISVSGNAGDNDYEIVGVIEDLPSNTTFSFSVLLSMPSMEKVEGVKIDDDWDNWRFRTYLKCALPIAKMNEVLKNHILEEETFQSDETTWYLRTLPINELHLTTIEQDLKIYIKTIKTAT